jgi:hypothetical protein
VLSIDERVGVGRLVRQGEVIGLGVGPLRITPPAGWSMVREVDADALDEPLTPRSIEFGDGDLLCTVRVAPFTGTPDELLDEVVGDSLCLGSVDQRAIRTIEGVDGRLAAYHDSVEYGLAAAFVVASSPPGEAPIGVELVTVGPGDAIAAAVPLIEEMLAGLRSRP